MELWDAYHRDGTPAPVKLTRGEPIPDGLYHIVSEILVRHIDGSYLVMLRDPRKESNPSRWEASAGGSALVGETGEACARRELQEETGLSGEFTFLCRHIDGHTFHDDYLCVTGCDTAAVTLQEGETTAYKWLNEPDFIAFIHSPEAIARQVERFRDYYVSKGYMKP